MNTTILFLLICIWCEVKDLITKYVYKIASIYTSQLNKMSIVSYIGTHQRFKIINMF